ncbi:Signal transduction histidine kinase [Catalinimonas alkaloidigena]|uniref:histidine kinase n=1 Tax=Catalinimonas alkaloidigena TaxID=1075417 RepID=A0A1G9A9N6_9BACT|nr:HAMP domain-containing sensor histidine kinase [Catalinimonas alkaloidigena]SDK24082.1 Signal transduction histidine kinase [Catalinimonas alkaloidigena]
MKLIDKFTLWYFVVTALVLVAGNVLVLYIVQHRLLMEEERKLTDAIRFMATQLEAGEPTPRVYGYQTSLDTWPLERPEMPLRVVDTMVWFEPHQHTERELRATASYKVGQHHYYLEANTFIGEPDDIEAGVLQSLGWISLLLIGLVGVSSRLISQRVLAPFYQALQAVQAFDLKRHSHVVLPTTNTKEFRELNSLLASMMQRTSQEYRSLKEFTENASHELQTPLAVIRGKLELLLNSDGIRHEQAQLVMAAHAAVGKLARVHQALTLLNRVENQEFVIEQPIDFSTQVRATLNGFEELLDIKQLRLQQTIEAPVWVGLHPLLAEVLLSNLIGNAIRHNGPRGQVHVTLRPTHLEIRNTGPAPEIPVEQLFGRFRKGSGDPDSIGLGLAIVHQICTANHLTLRYDYAEGWHTLTVMFPA